MKNGHILCQNWLSGHRKSRFSDGLGGVIYSQLGMEFLSPTINMFIEDENFIKLAYEPEKYFSIVPTAVTDKYVDPIDPSVSYPKIRIDDIEICCLHYKDCADAISAWDRRRKRVNLDNVFVIGNSWNMHSDLQLVEKIADAPHRTIVFSTVDVPRDNVILLKDDFWHLDQRGIVRPNITDDIPGSPIKYFEKYFDYVEWFNS